MTIKFLGAVKHGNTSDLNTINYNSCLIVTTGAHKPSGEQAYGFVLTFILTDDKRDRIQLSIFDYESPSRLYSRSRYARTDSWSEWYLLSS